MKTRHDVFSHLVLAAESGQFLGPWCKLDCHSAFRRLTSQPAFGAHFTAVELVAAGLTAAWDQKLDAALPNEPVWLMAVNCAGECEPDQLVVGSQAISHHIGAVAAVLRDPRLRIMMSSRDLYVAFHMEDLAILWSLGMPAIPATGLATLGGPRLKIFCQQLGLAWSPLASGTACSVPTELSTGFDALVLSNWSIRKLQREVRPRAQAIAQHMGELERRLGLPLDVYVWTPSAEQLEDIRFSLEYGDIHLVKDALLTSSKEADDDVSDDVASREPQDYLQALQQWLTCQQTGAGPLRQESWRIVLKFQHIQVIEPLLSRALKTTNLTEQMRLLHLANLSELTLTQSLIVQAQFARHARESDSTAQDQGFEKLISLYKQISPLIERR